MFMYEYPRPSLTADIILLRHAKTWQIGLIKRKGDPFKGLWAFPGGFVNPNETPEQAGTRELQEETGVTDITLGEFRTIGTPGRDPRGWVVTVVFSAIVSAQTQLKAGDDAQESEWFELDKLPPLAFDHKQIFAAFLKDGQINVGQLLKGLENANRSPQT